VVVYLVWERGVGREANKRQRRGGKWSAVGVVANGCEVSMQRGLKEVWKRNVDGGWPVERERA